MNWRTGAEEMKRIWAETWFYLSNVPAVSPARAGVGGGLGVDVVRPMDRRWRECPSPQI